MRHISLEQIVQRCRQEAAQTYQQETGSCFELFRRAIEQQDTAAWEALQQQYRKLVLSWVHNVAQGTQASDPFDDLGQDTWFRFWRTLSHHPAPFSQRFPHVGAVLNYLNQCAISAFLDYERQLRRQTRIRELSTIARPGAAWDEAAHWENREQAERIKMIWEWIAKEVQDPQEKLLLSLSYEQNLPPATIARRYPAQFATADDVYRIKERILKRARRALVAKLAD